MSTLPDPAPLVAEAARAWSLPALGEVPIVTSGRLRTSLGLFDPRRGEVRLAAFLADAPPALYREVVLHELAHAAVHLVHGGGAAGADGTAHQGRADRNASAAPAARAARAARAAGASRTQRRASPRPRPHGREWKGFMRAVGLEPRVRLPQAEVAALLPAVGERVAARGSRARWRHECPVCQASRTAGRPVRRWRCAACLKAGRPGRLRIVRVGGAR